MAENRVFGISPDQMGQVFRAIVERSWVDPFFLRQLQAQPRAVLASMGWDLPPGQEIRFVMDTATVRHIVIPAPPTELASPVLRY